MARKFQKKSVRTSNDFIQIDLLPEVKRPRNFNVNILLLVLIAVVASWLVIYLPLTERQETLDRTLETRSDLRFERDLLREEIVGFNIEQNRLDLQEKVLRAEALGVDFFYYYDWFEDIIVTRDTIEIDLVDFDAVSGVFYIDVLAPSSSSFRNIEFLLVEELGDVLISIQYDVATLPVGNRSFATFILEVDFDAE